MQNKHIDDKRTIKRERQSTGNLRHNLHIIDTAQHCPAVKIQYGKRKGKE